MTLQDQDGNSGLGEADGNEETYGACAGNDDGFVFLFWCFSGPLTIMCRNLSLFRLPLSMFFMSSTAL